MDKESIENLEKQLDLFKAIPKLKPNLQKSLLQHGDKQFYEALCLLIYNILNGDIEIDEKYKQKLFPYRHFMRKLTYRSPLKEKKRLVKNQKGNWLPAIIAAAIGGVSQIVSSLINKDTPQE